LSKAGEAVGQSVPAANGPATVPVAERTKEPTGTVGGTFTGGTPAPLQVRRAVPIEVQRVQAGTDERQVPHAQPEVGSSGSPAVPGTSFRLSLANRHYLKEFGAK